MMNPESNKRTQQQIVVDITIRWENGQVALNAPDNPLIFMKVMSDAMDVYVLKMNQRALAAKSRIVQPGVSIVDKKLLDNARKG